MKIGELAARSGTTAKTVRFYEQAGLLPDPDRKPNGYRDYGPHVAERLSFIRRGQAAGLSLREVRQILAIHDRGDTPCRHVREILHARLDGVRGHIAELIALESHLESLLAYARDGEPTAHDRAGVCWILDTDPDADSETG
ncbi:DNA-binding transcriptional regulator, MerR family [Amycolatopsis marina]|uniref:DNA-binding transcriptional regulator, MerR family n=1 Tax=Amycolatopsis marina TaxID=490629 RepID=A0A1I1CNV9_9PSEU|nr:heavy metal-responsive transcriptional regulator [Amycolatopsis marina]SFB62588.1 DNA-binding transcriptional regulator, MerR family [Amycolatopsis marina]